MTEQPIIDPIPVEVLRMELTPERQLRMTSKAGNEIYDITAHECPNTMREIGRLREIAFRAGGGGTGKECDIDEYDTMENPCRQLIVWDPEAEKIIGGYRYITGPNIRYNAEGQPIIATGHLFHFSETFIKEYLPYTIELGRSFVTVEYQSTRAGRKGIFALDNLWDGLGALAVIMPGCRYFFGKMTMYPTYDRKARDMILYFLKKYFPDPDGLVIPLNPLQFEHDTAEFEKLFNKNNFREDYKTLSREVRAVGLSIPPLVNAYMMLSPTMKMFGTAINDEFGDVEESGILIAVGEIYDEKRIRYIDNFAKEHPEYVQITSGANKVIS